MKEEEPHAGLSDLNLSKELYMCFSATASFAASATLTALGIYALSRAKHPATYLLAAFPLIFAIQQASEGMVWLGLTNPAFQQFLAPATYFFLFFALAWWPFWIPLSLALLEPHILQKKILINLLTFGTFFAFYELFCLFYYGAIASIQGCHISYGITIPGELHSLLGVLYLIPAVIPFFVSSIWGMNLLAGAILASYVISYFFYYFCFLSVWCFFAAVLSMLIIAIIQKIDIQD
jgi:hypothetical protein